MNDKLSLHVAIRNVNTGLTAKTKGIVFIDMWHEGDEAFAAG